MPWRGNSAFSLRGVMAVRGLCSDSADSFLLSRQQLLKITCTAQAGQRGQLFSLHKCIHHGITKGHGTGRRTEYFPLQMHLEEQRRFRITRRVPLPSPKQAFPAKLSQLHALPRRDPPGFFPHQLSPAGLGHQGCSHQSSLSSLPFKAHQADSSIRLPLTRGIPAQLSLGQMLLHQKKSSCASKCRRG